MNTALALAERSTCPRKAVGAVITRNNRILATGYNGSPPGTPHCLDIGCMVEFCKECGGSGGLQQRCPNCNGTGVSSGCKRTIHAELNAIIQCALHGVSPEGGLIYVTTRPCYACAMALASAGIDGIVYFNDYRTEGTDDLFKLMDETGIHIWRALSGNVVNGLDNPESFTLKRS
jgi:dCMP deaminase